MFFGIGRLGKLYSERISVKCDTDTVACIAGGIADAYYGGTGLEEEALLKRFLIKPNNRGEFDTFLFEWATKTPEQAQKEREAKIEKGERRERKGRHLLMIVITYQSKLGAASA